MRGRLVDPVPPLRVEGSFAFLMQGDEAQGMTPVRRVAALSYEGIGPVVLACQLQPHPLLYHVYAINRFVRYIGLFGCPEDE